MYNVHILSTLYSLHCNYFNQVGLHLLSIEYQGIINDKLRGFYRTRNVAPDGSTVFAAVTQFEPVAARLAFPCWDEPSFKATFDVTLVVPKDRVALSNMVCKIYELLRYIFYLNAHIINVCILIVLKLSFVPKNIVNLIFQSHKYTVQFLHI